MIDPAVTPLGQFTVANALPSGETFVIPSGHYTVPESAAAKEQLDTRIVGFLDE